MTTLNVVSLSASPHEPSKTTALLDAVVSEFETRFEMLHQQFLISDIAAGFGGALSRDEVDDASTNALRSVEGCDLLIVATPTYRATYTGLFKHFFDFVGMDALAGKAVFLSAIGGNDSHSLMIEHQLRPLFGFFRANTLPMGIFAENAEFENNLPTAPLKNRISSAVDAALPMIRITEA